MTCLWTQRCSAVMPNSSAAPCLPLLRTALTAKARQSLAAFCRPLIRELSEPYGKQHSKPQAFTMWKQWQQQWYSYLHRLGNEIACVGFLFLALGIIDLMNMVAILHHCSSGLGMTSRLICQGHRNDVPWLQVKGPASVSFSWLPAQLPGYRCSPLSWDLAFPPWLSLLPTKQFPENSQVTILRWSCPQCLFVSGES